MLANNDNRAGTESAQRPLLAVAVRALSESARQTGGLGNPLYAGISGAEGTRLHQEFMKNAKTRFPDDALFFEVPLSGTFSGEAFSFDLAVHGRCDVIAVTPEGKIRLIEIKGFRGSEASLPKDGDPVHLAQALLYAHLLLSGEMDTLFAGTPPQTDAVETTLCYISADTGAARFIRKTYSREALALVFEKTCTRFCESSRLLIAHRQERDRKNRDASFPYMTLRSGQKDMMREVIAAIRDRTVLFVSAPTGIGKTMAALYPAVKAQANGLTQQIFYLTPTRSQRKVAEDALDDLCREGFVQRSITIRAKEQMCLSPAHFCNMQCCPYAETYYERLSDAVSASYATPRLTPSRVLDLAKKHRICPFSLSLDLLATCDTVICDYNYIFNPRVRWNDLLDDPKARYTILVDEAHNLAGRSREMFSAFLSRTELIKWREQFLNAARACSSVPNLRIRPRDTENVLHAVDRLIAETGRFSSLLEQGNGHHKAESDSERLCAGRRGDENGAPPLQTGREEKHDSRNGIQLADPPLSDPDAENTRTLLSEELKPLSPVLSGNFLATREIPAFLLRCISALTGILTRFFDDYREFPGREALLTGYFDLLFFQRVAERYYDGTYITCFRAREKQEVAVSLMSLDASSHLTALYYGHSPVIFFSATLSPIPYYQSLLDAHAATDHPETIRLPSPFPPERRLVIAFEAHSIRYGDRARTLPAVARLITAVIRQRKGHYLIFSPSFSYQRTLANELRRIKTADTDWMVQPAQMTEKQKNAFLARFRQPRDGRALAGLTVLGSLFNEGIDLVGEELTGIIVIGTGLPALSPERDLLRQYYDVTRGQGFEFAYLWPGFNRVTQAAGRLIRSEQDFGLVLLIDDRYSQPVQKALLPEDWHTVHTSDPEECIARIQDFWKEIAPPDA